jgi:hypothetical protein
MSNRAPQARPGTHKAFRKGETSHGCQSLWTQGSRQHHPQPTSATPPIPEDTTLEQITTEMLGLMAKESLNHHRMGQLYNFTVEKKLAQKAGYKDAKDFFSQRLVDLSQATLTTYGAVAEHFSATVARRFGVTCLSLLLTYAELAGLKLDYEEPGSTSIEVPDEKGHMQALPFSNCSLDQMRRALQRKRKPTSSQPVPAENEVAALCQQLRGPRPGPAPLCFQREPSKNARSPRGRVPGWSESCSPGRWGRRRSRFLSWYRGLW